jgi:hypothetical protein
MKTVESAAFFWPQRAALVLALALLACAKSPTAPPPQPMVSGPQASPVPPAIPNSAPVVTVGFEGASVCAPEGSRACSLTVVAQATDPDGDALTYAWSGCATGTAQRAVCTVTRDGVVVATVEVRDDHDHLVSASATGEGRGNSPPIVTVAFQGASTCAPQIGKPCTLEVVAQASDPDGDSLRYAWSGCASGTSAHATCLVQRPGTAVASVEVSDDHGHVVRSESPGTGGGTNRPPGLQIGYVTLLPNSNSFDLLGNVIDPDEGFLCGRQYCSTISASGACRGHYLDCTCLGGLEAEVTRTAPTGMCTVTFVLKDSWGQEGTPTFTFDVSTGRPVPGSSLEAAPGTSSPGTSSRREKP